MSSEKSSLVGSIVNQNSINAQINLSLSVLHFEPSIDAPRPVYWGYLLRVDKFAVSINDKTIQSGGEAKEHWDKAKVMALEAVRRILGFQIREPTLEVISEFWPCERQNPVEFQFFLRKTSFILLKCLGNNKNWQGKKIGRLFRFWPRFFWRF